MVRRDPKLRDKFPPVPENRIATDEERNRNYIPATCHVVVPLGMPTDKFAYGFSDHLRGLATEIEYASKMDIPDVRRLRRIQMSVNAFNARWRGEVKRAHEARGATISAMSESDVAAEEWFQDGSKMMDRFKANELPQGRTAKWQRLKELFKAHDPRPASELKGVRMAERTIANEEWYKKGTLMMGLRNDDSR